MRMIKGFDNQMTSGNLSNFNFKRMGLTNAK